MAAYSRFFNKLGGRPTIQSRHGKQAVWITSELFEFIHSYCDLKTKDVYYTLRIGTKKHPLGMLEFTAHKTYRVPKTISISVHAGRWHLSFNYDDDIVEPDEKDTIAWLRQHRVDELRTMTLGIDRGVALPLATSDCRSFGFSEIQEKRIGKQDKYKKRWQRRMARRVKGSDNYHKARRRVARHQRYGVDVRRDVAHTTSYILVSDDRYKLYVLEALKVRNMTASAKGTADAPGKNVRQKAGLNRGLLSAMLGQTKTYMQYKARRSGKLCLEVSPHYSSQECAACGFTHPDNRPSQAVFVCQRCDNRDHADFNAGKVIALRGVTLLLSDDFGVKKKKRVALSGRKVGAECSETVASPPTLVETCVRRQALMDLPLQSLKQETPTTSHRL